MQKVQKVHFSDSIQQRDIQDPPLKDDRLSGSGPENDRDQNPDPALTIDDRIRIRFFSLVEYGPG